jgi:hypothetical protein
MLTIQVNDAHLESQLTQRAQATGKPAQQVAKLLAEALVQLVSVKPSFRALDPSLHIRPLQFDVDPSTDDSPAFQRIYDTTEFASTLRRNAWKC